MLTILKSLFYTTGIFVVVYLQFVLLCMSLALVLFQRSLYWCNRSRLAIYIYMLLLAHK